MAAQTAPRTGGRRIADQDEGERPVQNTETEGVSFVKNQVNELIKFKDGSTHQFRKSRETYTDPAIIEKIREVAEQFGIFEQ